MKERIRINLKDKGDDYRNKVRIRLLMLGYKFHRQYTDKAPFVYINPKNASVSWGYPVEHEKIINLGNLRRDKGFEAEKKINKKPTPSYCF